MYIMDIQLETSFQRKGLGRHLMRTLEMIARKQVFGDCLLMLSSLDLSLATYIDLTFLPILRFALSLSFSKSKQEMPHIMMPVVVKNDGAREFVMRGLNGWIVENFSSVVSQLSTLSKKHQVTNFRAVPGSCCCPCR